MLLFKSCDRHRTLFRGNRSEYITRKTPGGRRGLLDAPASFRLGWKQQRCQWSYAAA